MNPSQARCLCSCITQIVFMKTNTYQEKDRSQAFQLPETNLVLVSGQMDLRCGRTCRQTNRNWQQMQHAVSKHRRGGQRSSAVGCAFHGRGFEARDRKLQCRVRATADA